MVHRLLVVLALVLLGAVAGARPTASAVPAELSDAHTLYLPVVQPLPPTVPPRRCDTPLAESPLPILPREVVVRSACHAIVPGQLTSAIVGELYNGLDRPIHQMRVAVWVYDSTGRRMGGVSGPALYESMVPGAIVPFRLVLFDYTWPAPIVGYAISEVTWVDEPAYPSDPIEVLSAEPRTVNGVVEISGEVRNSLSYRVSPVVFATFYDAAGNVVYVLEQRLSATLGPGQRAAYTLTAPQPFSYARYQVQARGDG